MSEVSGEVTNRTSSETSRVNPNEQVRFNLQDNEEYDAFNEEDDDFKSDYTNPADLAALRQQQERFDEPEEVEEEVHVVRITVNITGCFPIGNFD
jgi:hypothetical protein